MGEEGLAEQNMVRAVGGGRITPTDRGCRAASGHIGIDGRREGERERKMEKEEKVKMRC